MDEGRYRVMVHLTDVDLEEEKEAIIMSPIVSGISSLPPSIVVLDQFGPHNAVRLEVQDGKTLLLRRKNSRFSGRYCQEMHFHSVGLNEDLVSRNEYANMIEKLIIKRVNCALIRFTLMRECNSSLLSNLLVREVEKRMQHSRTSAISIRMDFYDVQKFDVINLFDRAAMLGAPRSKHVIKTRPRNHFNNTLEMLKWLQEEYTRMWSVGRGHSILEVCFKFTEVKRRIQHQVKFALVQIHIFKMDADSKITLRNYLENLDGAKRTRSSTITDCLQDYFHGPEYWCAWLLFEVPRHRLNHIFIDEMLTLAKAAYSGVRAVGTKTEENFDIDFIGCDNSCSSTTRFCSRSRLLTARVDNRSNLSRSTSAISGRTLRSDRFSSADRNNLNFWYQKMDERFYNVLVAMEHYFDAQKVCKIECLNNGLNPKAHSMDSLLSVNTSVRFSQNRESKNICKSCRELQSSGSHYKSALESFRKLNRAIEHSKFADLLQVYLKAKNQELAQHVLNLKEQMQQTVQHQTAKGMGKSKKLHKVSRTHMIF